MRKRIVFDIDEAKARKLKSKVFLEGMTITEVMNELVDEYLKRG